MAELIKIAEGRAPGKPDWPYEVSILQEPGDRFIVLSEGVHHASLGGAFTAEELLGTQWIQDHLAYADCLWVLDWIRTERVEGRPVDARALELFWERREA